MRILFDQGTPAPLRKALEEHVVDTAFERGWSAIQNSELLKLAEDEGYDLIVTTDQNIKYQQNLKTRRIAVLVLTNTSWRRLKPHSKTISEIIGMLQVGDYREFSVPDN